ncbi:MAG: hypothetical protein FGF53_07925 [Candidatus Brockarchaeota archaeon]|nr:hypothetical protein [Candidatus Brockarchaeota archaeon]MBO3809300.1 hypothetical protein [Candidatus Brockarchaeota archaeon]
MDISEREETTKYAVKKIDSFLENKEYTSALLLSSIYVHIRLRSLLTDRLNPPKDKWKEISKIRINFRLALKLCIELGIIPKSFPCKLKKLWKKRNEVAHESKIWKNLQESEIEEIKRLWKPLKIF